MAAGSAGAADLQARDWAMSCLSCHNIAAPAHARRPALKALDGRSADALLAQLRDLRDGRPPSTLMRQLLAGYQDDELARIAAYFASRAAAPPAGR
ncbi:hypothetical protein GCM10027419_52120 [Pandoraea terrae]